jgi:hypothetical protein
MSVSESVESALDGDESPLAAQARALAAEMDNSRNGGTSKALISKELRETLAALRALAPPKIEEDEVELARKRRADRLARGAAAGASSSS